MSLLDKLAKVGIKSNLLEDSDVYNNRDVTSIDSAPIVNIALSGDIEGGLGSGVGILAGASKHYKSNTGLLMVAAYLNKHKDATCIFYDSEFGSPPAYWKNFGIDISRILHVTIENLEDLKFDLPQKLQEITSKDKVIIFVDSIGNLASKKEADDAIDGKSTTDMTRAREMKSMFRIVTPMIKTRNIPAIFVAHTYQTMELYCLKGDTKIKTSTGSKEIKDIQVGEYVYALNGLKEVTNKYLPEDLPTEGVKYLKLTFDDNTIVECTDTHKFLMENNEWKQAGDIKLGESFK